MSTTLEKENWKSELDKTALRYHTIACWIGVVFNLLFFVTDFINIYDYWQPFLLFRIGVSSLILLAVVFRKQLKIPIELLGVIPVLLISIQNAYMWSVMDVDHLQRHAFAYKIVFTAPLRRPSPNEDQLPARYTAKFVANTLPIRSKSPPA